MNQVPAHLLQRQSRNLAQSAVRGLGGNNPPHLSIRKNRFTLVDAAGNEWPVETFHLDVVIIDVNDAPGPSKLYFASEYDPENRDPPVCWSDNGIGPSSQASTPQSPTCAICPHNAWGSETSRLTGKPTKACNDVKKIAILVPGFDIPFLLRIPPASLKLFKAYALSIGAHAIPGAGRNFDLSDVLTRLSFDDKSQGVLNFVSVGYTDEAQAAQMEQWWAAKKTDLMVGRGDVPVGKDRVGLAPVAQTRAIEAAPKPSAAPPPTPPVAQTFAPVAAPQQFGQMTTEAPKRSRGRPRVVDAPPTQPASQSPAQQVAAAAAADPMDIPPFLQKPQTVQAAVPPKPAQQFGMAQPAEPNQELADAVAAAFRLPT